MGLTGGDIDILYYLRCSFGSFYKRGIMLDGLMYYEVSARLLIPVAQLNGYKSSQACLRHLGLLCGENSASYGLKPENYPLIKYTTADRSGCHSYYAIRRNIYSTLIITNDVVRDQLYNTMNGARGEADYDQYE